MINLKMIGTREDLIKETGLSSDELWDAGFNLDDWDVCFVSDTPLHSSTLKSKYKFGDEEYEEEEYDLDYDAPQYEDAHWLFWRMDSYCVGFNYVELNGKHYYTVHHS